MLRRVSVESITQPPVCAVDAQALAAVSPIVAAVREGGTEALKRYATLLDGWAESQPLVLGRAELEDAFVSLPDDDRALLSRCADNVLTFALRQRASLHDLTMPVPGGRAGHKVLPVARAGCYAPGGRYPLPSSVLMNVGAARTAGVPEIWVASPRPSVYALAAAWAGGATRFLAAGGAHAIAALAYGCGSIPACDVITGPGNKYVTAAKFLVSQNVRIDMAAGPSELLIIADESARPDLIAADLLAQAEHGPDSLPMLLSFSERILAEVDRELAAALPNLPGAELARESLAHGFACLVRSTEQAVRAVNTIGPEHLQLMVSDPLEYDGRLLNFGALFIGNSCAEVLGDYCLGPNHVLPTGGMSRTRGGLSVLDFLRVHTWMEIDDPSEACAAFRDAVRLGEIENLRGHARAAQLRLR